MNLLFGNSTPPLSSLGLRKKKTRDNIKTCIGLTVGGTPFGQKCSVLLVPEVVVVEEAAVWHLQLLAAVGEISPTLDMQGLDIYH